MQVMKIRIGAIRRSDGCVGINKRRTCRAVGRAKVYLSQPRRMNMRLYSSANNDEVKNKAEKGSSSSPVTDGSVSGSQGESQQRGLAKGQSTAIITGAISIIFGIAYLALVQFMDLRGGELQPPPPEAFME